jgi:hypothetical protein
MTVRLMLKVCSVAALVALVVFALGPAKWTPRSGLGFEFDHFVGSFFFTLLFCLAWPRPFAGRRSPRGLGGGAGKLAIFSTGSLILLCSGFVQCCRCLAALLAEHASTKPLLPRPDHEFKGRDRSDLTGATPCRPDAWLEFHFL